MLVPDHETVRERGHLEIVATEKIREVRELIEAEDLDVDVQVDGGINDETMETVLTAGANLLVAGSYVFNDDLAKNVKHARERMDEIIRRID